jgi:hypothetical protein
MCGLPLVPLPWLSMWEMSLEERAEKETWEKTRWAWENTTYDRIGERTSYWVRDMRHLPHIVTDHGVGRDNMHQQGDTRQGDKADRTRNICIAEDDCKDSFLVAAYSTLDLLVHVDEKHRHLETSDREANDKYGKVPITVESSESEADDDEMEDYYENHKAWPSSSS